VIGRSRSVTFAVDRVHVFVRFYSGGEVKRFLLPVLGFLLASVFLAQSIPDLFGKAKEEIKAGSWAEASKTLDALEAEANKPGQEGVKKQLEGPLAFYRGVAAANLGKTDDAVESFGAFLKVQPGASIDKNVYSKKAVAAFEKAQKAAAERAPSLAEAYKEFTPPPATETADQYWGDGPVQWIMRPAEKQAWAALTDPNARVAFVEEFWTARAKLPGPDGTTYRQEFERRVAFADANLSQDPEKRGSLTDRGMVFVLFGPPNWAARKPMRSGDEQDISDGLSTVGSQDAANAQRGARAGQTTSGRLATKSAQFAGPGKTALGANTNTVETWHYRRELLPSAVPYQELDFKFLTKQGYGVSVLQRESNTVTALEAAKPAIPAS
jgi:GWxTD domain-containing protein